MVRLRYNGTFRSKQAQDDLAARFAARRHREDKRYIAGIQENLRSMRQACEAMDEPRLPGSAPSFDGRKKPVVSERCPVFNLDGSSEPSTVKETTWSVVTLKFDSLLAESEHSSMVMVIDLGTRSVLSCSMVDHAIDDLNLLIRRHSVPRLIEVAPDACVEIPRLEQWAVSRGIAFRMLLKEKNA